MLERKLGNAKKPRSLYGLSCFPFAMIPGLLESCQIFYICCRTIEIWIFTKLLVKGEKSPPPLDQTGKGEVLMPYVF